MAWTSRKSDKTLENSSNRGAASLSPTDKNDLLPYKKLRYQSPDTMTNFEKFMKTKLIGPQMDASNPQKALKQTRITSFDKSLPIATSSDKICITLESKRSRMKTSSSEPKLRKQINTSSSHLLNNQSTNLSTMDSYFRSRSQGKLNRDMKKIVRLTKELQRNTQEGSLEKSRKESIIHEKKEPRENIPKLSQISSFHCFLNKKAYLSPRQNTLELSKGISLGQIRKELGVSLTERDSENNNKSLSKSKAIVTNVIKSKSLIKSVHANPQQLNIPIIHLEKPVIHQEDQASKEPVETSKGSLSNVQAYDPSFLQDGSISPSDNVVIIDKQERQESFEETTDKQISLLNTQSYFGDDTNRARKSRAKEFEQQYNFAKRSSTFSLGLINSERADRADRASSPLNSSRIPSKERLSFRGELKKEYLPDWLEKRKDFKDACRGIIVHGRKSVPNTLMKPSYSRTAEEIEIVASWLQKVKVFRMLPKALIYNIVEKIKVRNYRRNQILCYQGDPGDCLYIVHGGIVRCLIDGVPVAHYKSGDSIGQTSLDSTLPRTATLMATTTSTILRLEIDDYRLIMEYYSMKQKSEFKETLLQVRGFDELSSNKIAIVSSHLQSKFYVKGEVIYHQDDSSEALYILKQGLVIIESNVSLEKENFWPVGKQLWEKCTVIRNKKVSHIVKPYSFFGDMELVRNCDRLNTAVCGEDCHVLILNKKHYSELFDSTELNYLKKVSEEQIYEDTSKMKQEVLDLENEKKKMKKVMIKALTDHLGPLSSYELKKRNSRFGPAIEKVQQDYKTFMRRNTTAAVKVYEKLYTNE